MRCKKEIEVNKHSSPNRVLCKDCKQTKILKCKICGSTFNKFEHCQNDFCHKHNLQQLNTFIKYFGFDKSKLGTTKVEEEFNRIRNILIKLYWEQNMSGSDIAKKFNYPSAANITGKIFKYCEIPTRTFKECSINAYLTGNNKHKQLNNNFKSCNHLTWNNKSVYLRSSYELDYAKQLDKQKIDYEVESLRIKYINSKDNKEHCAIPDFYIPEENMIVEIKSNWTLDKQEMKDKFKAYKKLGYNCKLILEHKEVNLNDI